MQSYRGLSCGWCYSSFPLMACLVEQRVHTLIVRGGLHCKGRSRIPNDFVRLEKWSGINMTKFNKVKCTELH